MEIKDLEIEAIKMDSFKAGYTTALMTVAKMLEQEKKNEPVKKDIEPESVTPKA